MSHLCCSFGVLSVAIFVQALVASVTSSTRGLRFVQALVASVTSSTRGLRRMPSRCLQDGCCFGSGNRPAFVSDSSKTTCSLCRSPEEQPKKEGRARDCLVRQIRFLDNERRERWYASMAAEPELVAIIKGKVTELDAKASVTQLTQTTTPKKNATTRRGRSRSPPAVTSRPPQIQVTMRHDCLPRLVKESLDQGNMPLCSAYASAVALSHALAAKYELVVEPQRIMDRWLDGGVPSKPQWPDDFLAARGTVRLTGLSISFAVRANTIVYTTFEKTAHMVKRMAGFRCIVVVAFNSDREPVDGKWPTHSLVAIRQAAGGDLLCQNSWGNEARPIVRVSRDEFCKAFLIDPSVLGFCVPLESRIEMVEGPPVSAEWVSMLRCE